MTHRAIFTERFKGISLIFCGKNVMLEKIYTMILRGRHLLMPPVVKDLNHGPINTTRAIH